MDNIYTILIVDDHNIVISGLKLLIQAHKMFKVIAEANNASDAIEYTQKLKPDIIILDISLPNISGLDIIARLKEISQKSKILVLTMHQNQQYVQKALDDGASGYILKEAADEDLIYALKTIIKDNIYIQPSLVSQIYAKKSKIQKTREEILWETLSDREKEVAILVAKGFTNKEIGEKLFLSEKTIATYRMRAFSKLGMDKSNLINFVIKLNLLDL